MHTGEMFMRIFTEEFKETEIEFNGQTRILCEEFKVVYKAIDVN